MTEQFIYRLARCGPSPSARPVGRGGRTRMAQPHLVQGRHPHRRPLDDADGRVAGRAQCDARPVRLPRRGRARGIRGLEVAPGGGDEPLVRRAVAVHVPPRGARGDRDRPGRPRHRRLAAGSDDGRRKMYWPALVVFTCGLGFMAVGGCIPARAVYRYGTAVAAVQPLARSIPRPPAAGTARRPAIACHRARCRRPGLREADPRARGLPWAPQRRANTAMPPGWTRYFRAVQLHLLQVGPPSRLPLPGSRIHPRWSQEYGPLPASRLPRTETIRAGVPSHRKPRRHAGPAGGAGAGRACPARDPVPLFAARFLVRPGSSHCSRRQRNLDERDWTLEACAGRCSTRAPTGCTPGFSGTSCFG